jgi:glycosyltransferase involved in cell wall biosynthesis
MENLVSTIIPTFNRARLLERALDSVIAQDHRPLEVVLVDDGSTDDTPAVIERYSKKLAEQDVRLLVHRQQNGRAPKARNVGMKLARGTYFAFLDSDDLWRPTLVSTLVTLLRQHPSAGLAFSGITVIDADDRVTSMRDAGLQGHGASGALHRPFDLIMRYMPFQTSGVIVRRAVIEALGDFDLNLPVVEDWDLWYRIAKAYDFAYTLEPLACNRSHADNLPKYDVLALNSNLKMNLKHLPDVKETATREMLLDRMQRQFTLLQEELLRTGKRSDALEELLKHEMAPRTVRYTLGSVMAAGPAWIGRTYARLIRAVGALRRT